MAEINSLKSRDYFVLAPLATPAVYIPYAPPGTPTACTQPPHTHFSLCPIPQSAPSMQHPNAMSYEIWG